MNDVSPEMIAAAARRLYNEIPGMAQAPKCKLCGGAHWANQPHAFAKPAAPPADAIPEWKTGDAITQENGPTLTVVTILAEYLAAERAQRAAYMRGYRARAKANKDSKP